MADEDRLARLTRVRREPPPLRTVEVVERVELSPRLMRLTFEGDGLRGLIVTEPAASVRLLVPMPGVDELVIPEWDGNEFLLPGGSRPILRTFTPLRLDNEGGRLDIEIVRHPGGAVSGWAERVEAGAPAAISGPGTGFEFPGGAEHLLVLADETALPAVTQLFEMAPASLHVHAHVEVISDDAVLDLAVGDSQTIHWHTTAGGATPGTELVAIVQSLEAVADTTHIWAAGEASAMHAIRTHLFKELGLDRSVATVRGYWKPAR